ncbi:MAG: histidinol-phosphatase [Pseudonocardiales bacterium]|nr:histidinol-phosphatase [Pseudonocardiales bacterium]
MTSTPEYPPAEPDTGWAADLELALRLAELADTVTTGRFRSADLVVHSKPDLTPVSDADQAVEQLIRQRLAAARPHDGFCGEESGTAGSGPRQWVLDPIDGTKNFVRGVPVWATLIALLVRDEPVLGVVSAPALGQRWWAARGHGAFCSSLGQPPRRLRVSQVSRLADASLSYASLSGWVELGRQQAFVELTSQVWRSRAYGDFWSYMLLAEGAVDLAAEPELSLWDMAALAPIVSEAGGRFTGLNGVDGVQQGNAAASNGLLHEALLSALAEQR